MELGQCTKWELIKLVGSLPNQKKVKEILNQIERDREYSERYLEDLKCNNPKTVIYDVRNLKRLGFDPVTTANAVKRLNDEYKKLMDGIMDALEDIPVADVKEVVHAKWEPQLHYPGTYAKCSICGCRCGGYTPNYKYCPDCGAKMDGGKEG